MDEIDHVQEAGLHRQEAMLAAIRRQSYRGILPPAGGRDCESCGDPIPRARLERVPTALRCVDCQAAAERRAG